ncbi:hypothetical protein ABZ924_38470 [Streptomyces sp. NPDC046876]|uniref:hypothetical protein n=1 Tax=Streptomyces sp. NPDC046876 TaxID=3155616 RepID=UPI0033E4F128
MRPLDHDQRAGSGSEVGVGTRSQRTDTLRATFREVSAGPEDTVTPTLIMAVVRGLLFDLTATGDRHRTDRALDRFAELLAQ